MDESDDDLRETPPGSHHYHSEDSRSPEDHSGHGSRSPEDRHGHGSSSPPSQVLLIDGDKDTPYVVNLKKPDVINLEKDGGDVQQGERGETSETHDANGSIEMTDVKPDIQHEDGAVTFTVHHRADVSEHNINSPIQSPKLPDPHSVQQIVPTKCWSSGYSTGHHSDGPHSDSSVVMEFENQKLRIESERLQIEKERLQEEKERNLTERERNMTERERCQIERERCAIEKERCQIEKERLEVEKRRLVLEESRMNTDNSDGNI